MPGRNRMGPTGQGQTTGRGLGFCRGAHARAESAAGGPGFAVGRGGGRGGGFGNRFWFHATGLTGWQRAAAGWCGAGVPTSPAVSAEQDLAALKQQAEGLATEQGFSARIEASGRRVRFDSSQGQARRDRKGAGPIEALGRGQAPTPGAHDP